MGIISTVFADSAIREGVAKKVSIDLFLNYPLVVLSGLDFNGISHRSVILTMSAKNEEAKGLEEAREGKPFWKKWDVFLSERQ